MESFKKPVEELVKSYLIKTHKGQIDICERSMGAFYPSIKNRFGNLNDAVNRANEGYIAKPFFWSPGYSKSEVQFYAPLDNYMTDKGLHIAKFIEDADKANPTIAQDTLYELEDKVKELIDYCKKNDFFINNQYRLNEPQNLRFAISETERVTITYK